MIQRNLKVVITGGPGTGKSTLLEALEARGFRCFEEVSRSLIEEGKKKGMTNYFLEAPMAFSDALFEGRTAQYQAAENLPFQALKPIVFFDRGLLDVIAYLESLGQENTPLKNKARNYPYDRVVFLPPWKKIYHKDAQRLEEFEQADKLSQALWNTYSQEGVDPFVLAPGTVNERVEKLLNHLLS